MRYTVGDHREKSLDLAAWLKALGLAQYEADFRAHDIDADVLRTLTADDLKEFGVHSLGHRKRLLAAIGMLGGPGACEGEQASPEHLPSSALRRRGSRSAAS